MSIYVTHSGVNTWTDIRSHMHTHTHLIVHTQMNTHTQNVHMLALVQTYTCM